VLLGGEELHNNHHAFPASAKFSARRWEFDIGWLYIRVLEAVGLARVIRVAPEPTHVEPRRLVDLENLRAVIVNRMHVLRSYSRTVTLPVLRAERRAAPSNLLRGVRRLLVRHPTLLDARAKARLQEILNSNQALQTVHEFRERLKQLWSGANANNERLLAQFREWCAQAEASGIKALQEFALNLRGYGARRSSKKNPPPGGFFFSAEAAAYLILLSLYLTCLRATGSNFMVSSLSGCRRLFFMVV
jgi:stearoyl-CoA desaturase (delta-9 desaturase)